MIEDVFLAKSFWLKNKPVSAKALGISAAATKFLLRSIWNTRYEQGAELVFYVVLSSSYFVTFTPRVKIRKHLPKVNIRTLKLCYWPCFHVPLLLTLNRYLTERKNKLSILFICSTYPLHVLFVTLIYTIP